MPPIEVRRDEVRRLLDRGAQLVEVLSASAYEEEHLPGAISIPLEVLGPEAVARLNRTQPVIVYCYDCL
jgi:rhodanese-related sulfurtransferase